MYIIYVVCMNAPEYLYHYTSTDALMSILQSMSSCREGDDTQYITLRATHASYLNDKVEGVLLKKALEELGQRSDILNVLECCSGYPFVFSFSELEDDLNMWRCYAAEATGVAIGFDLRIPEFDLILKKCEYITQKKLVEKYKDLKCMRPGYDCTQLARVLQNLFCYKDIAFEAENEWRFIEQNVPHRYFLRSKTIVPYVEIKVPVSAIVSITFGPLADYERNKFSVSTILKGKVGDMLKGIELKKSNVPLR